MIVFESRKSRHVLVRLERGEELVGTLEALAKREHVRAAWVRGIGSLEWAQLDRHDQSRRVPEPPQRFETPCEILSLQGHVALDGTEPRVHVHVALSRRTDNGVDFLGGRLRSGAVFHCEIVLEVYDDLRIERAPDLDTGLSLWAGASSKGPSAPRPAAPVTRSAWDRAMSDESSDDDRDDDGRDDERDDVDEVIEPTPRSGGVSWADVAAVSAAPEVVVRERPRREAPRPTPPPDDAPREAAFKPPPIPTKKRASEEEFLTEPVPERGDWIDHRQFGLCKVDREDDEGGLVLRLPSGIRKTIRLDFMEVGQPRNEGGKRVFPVRPRRR